MDTQFDWLGSLQSQSSSQSSNGAQPPAVSFGFSNGHVSPESLPETNTSNAGYLRDSVPVSDSESVPLSLRAQDLTLEESKTYMRWYSDILARCDSRTIAISDVYQFLGNFKIAPETRSKINSIFSKILSSINIGEFFAVLRVVSHALQGHEPARTLIKVQTNVPVPPSILSKKRQNDDVDEGQDQDEYGSESPGSSGPSQPAAPLDLDSFTQFMLTGQRPNESTAGLQSKKKSKKLKSVKFTDDVVTDIQHTYRPAESPQQPSNDLDYSLPMDQLLSRINASVSSQNPSNASSGPQNSLAVPSYDRHVTSPDPEEKQILRDMEPQINHFQNLHSVDTISVDGVPSNIHLRENSDLFSPRNASPQPPLLKPNMTGPAQMASMGVVPNSEDWNQPLRPNVTGPSDMARFLGTNQTQHAPKVSLQAFTSQMTSNTVNNTEQNARIGQASIPSSSSLPPPIPATRRVRSVSQPSPLNLNWESQMNQSGEGLRGENAYDSAKQGPPVPARSQPGHSQRLPPPPPPPRSRRVSNSSSPQPPPLPAKIPNEPFYQAAEAGSSTANILDDLKALQEEVDKIRDLTGGF